MIHQIVVFVPLSIIIFCLGQSLIFPVINLNKKIEDTIKNYKQGKDKFLEIYNSGVISEVDKSVDRFLISLKFDRQDNEPIRKIVKIIGFFEIIIFGLLSLILLNNDGGLIFSQNLLTIIGAWLGIKVIGNYQQWSDPILGRAVFYVFLIGTLVNIFAGIILGILSIILSNHILII